MRYILVLAFTIFSFCCANAQTQTLPKIYAVTEEQVFFIKKIMSERPYKEVHDFLNEIDRQILLQTINPGVVPTVIVQAPTTITKLNKKKKPQRPVTKPSKGIKP